MPIPIAKDQAEYKIPDVSGAKGQAPEIMRINTGLPEATNDLVKSVMNAHNVLAQIKVDNDTVKANQLTLQLEQQLSDAMNSTETDENGNVIGFLHKQGEDAFNSLPELDKNIAGIYNGYLKEMSQLSPVAIEKLLLRGKDLVNDTQKNAFNYSYEEHEKYNKNNAVAMSNNIIVNAKATDGVVDQNINNDLNALMQQQELINKGQSDEVKKDAIRTAIEKYFDESLNSTDNKHSSNPTLGGGATYAVRQLKDAFNKGLIGKQYFDKKLKQYEKEMCATAVIRGGVTNYDKVFNLVLSREGLTTQEKEEYLASYQKNIDKISAHAKGMLDDGSMHYKLIQANALPENYELKRTLEEMFKNPYSFIIDDKGKLMHFDNEKLTKTDIDTWLKDNGLHNLLKSEESVGFVKEMALYVQALKNNGATDSDWKKLITMFNSVSKSPLNQEQLAQEEINQSVLGNIKYKTTHDSGQEKIKDKIKATSKANADAFNLATLTAYNQTSTVESSNLLKTGASKMLSDAFNDIVSSSSESDVFDQQIDALEALPLRFQKDPDAWFDEEENKYITFLAAEQLASYAKNAKSNRGYYVNIPTDTQGGVETFLYKGNINYGNILRDVTYQVLNDDRIKNVGGMSLENKFANMDKNQKEYVLNIIENKVKDEIFKSMANDTNNILSSSKDSAALSRDSYAYKYIMNRAFEDYRGTVDEAIVPFEKTEQKVEEKPNFYKQFTYSDNDLPKEANDFSNKVRGTYRRVVDTNNVTKINDNFISELDDILRLNGSDKPDSIGLYKTLNDIKNNKMVFQEDAEAQITRYLNTLSSLYIKQYNSDLSEDLKLYEQNKGDIDDYAQKRREMKSAIESGGTFFIAPDNQGYYGREREFYSAYKTLSDILKDVRTKRLYIDYSKFKEVRSKLR